MVADIRVEGAMDSRGSSGEDLEAAVVETMAAEGEASAVVLEEETLADSEAVDLAEADSPETGRRKRECEK